VVHEVSDHLGIIPISNVGSLLLEAEHFTPNNLNNFQEALNSVDWTQFNHVTNLDESCKVFENTINNYATLCFEPKKGRPSLIFKFKWYDGELLKLSRKKDRLHKNYLRNQTLHSLQKYHITRNKYFHLIHLKKKAYIQNKLQASFQNIKKAYIQNKLQASFQNIKKM